MSFARKKVVYLNLSDAWVLFAWKPNSGTMFGNNLNKITIKS
jgi:hypothetical protein